MNIESIASAAAQSGLVNRIKNFNKQEPVAKSGPHQLYERLRQIKEIIMVKAVERYPQYPQTNDEW